MNAWTETARYATPEFDAEITAQYPDRRTADAYVVHAGSVVQSDGVLPAPVVYSAPITSVGPIVPFSAETHKTTEQHALHAATKRVASEAGVSVVHHIIGYDASGSHVGTAVFHDATDAKNLASEWLARGVASVSVSAVNA